MPREPHLRLHDMIQACSRIARYVEGIDEATFVIDELRLDGVIRNIEILGEAAKTVPESIRTLAPELDWRNIARMRDRIAHQYFSVDPAVVWKAAVDFAPPLKAAVERLLARLQS